MDKNKRIDLYEENYLNNYDFEKTMVFFRQKFIKNLLIKYKPKSILEIGCGYDLLFNKMKEFNFIEKWIIVEPARKFCEHAKKITDKRMVVINGFLEDEINRLKEYEYDFVICSSLLHEIENVDLFLKSIKFLSKKDTIIHFNVPNASSFHRQLAKEMGYIKDIFEKSERNKNLTQYHVFDKELLKEKISKYFFIFEEGGYFIKPFTHNQMLKIQEVLDNYEDILYGLYKLGIKYPELAAEIFVNCKVINED